MEDTMKKIFMLLIAMCFMFTTGIAFAASAVTVPTVSGNDVLMPPAFINTVANSGDKVVAVMHDARGASHEVAMTFDGTNWIAPGARGADFHPAVKTAEGYKWARIEDVWDTGAAFVKWRDAGPCLHVN